MNAEYLKIEECSIDSLKRGGWLLSPKVTGQEQDVLPPFSWLVQKKLRLKVKKCRGCVISNAATACIWKGEGRMGARATRSTRGHSTWPLFSANEERLLVKTLKDGALAEDARR